MWDDADHFRKRALECRRLAENAREGDKQILIEMADELEQEAERIEANVEPGA